MRRRFGIALLAAAALTTGCGGDDDGNGDPPEGVAGVERCLEEGDRFNEVTPIDADELDTAALSARQRRTIDSATSGSTDGLVTDAGGPTEEDGVITEAPVSKTRLYFFATETEAEQAATQIEPVAGEPGENTLNGVEAIGKVAVVHYSYGIGDSPGEAPLDAAPIERCLREGGFA